MRSGLPGATAMTSLLPAKACGAATRSPAASMFFVSAVASTSAGAPCRNCVTRSLLPAKLKVTFTSGWAAVKSPPSWVKASLSDAAAKTLSSRDRPPPASAVAPQAPTARAKAARSATTAASDRRAGGRHVTTACAPG